MVDICREGHSQRVAPQNRHKAHPRARTETEALTGRGEVALHLERVRSSSSWFPELLGPEGYKTQSQPSLQLCGVPENLNLSGLDLGGTHNSGPAPCRATWSLCSVDRKSTHAVSGGKPSVAKTLWALPTHTSDICLQCPSLPTARWTSEPKQETTSTTLCQGRN